LAAGDPDGRHTALTDALRILDASRRDARLETFFPGATQPKAP
jgi:hypothetical protein